MRRAAILPILAAGLLAVFAALFGAAVHWSPSVAALAIRLANDAALAAAGAAATLNNKPLAAEILAAADALTVRIAASRDEAPESQGALGRARLLRTEFEAAAALGGHEVAALGETCAILDRAPPARGRDHLRARCRLALGEAGGSDVALAAFDEAWRLVVEARDPQQLALARRAARQYAAAQLGRDQPAAAIAVHRDAIAFADTLPESTNRDLWQAALFVAIGDLERGREDAEAILAYRAGLEILERVSALPDAGPEHIQKLVTVYNKIGDWLLEDAGDPMGALIAFEAGLMSAERSARLGSDAATFRREIAVSHNRIGDARVALDDLVGARRAYLSGLEVTRALALSEPLNEIWQRDLSISYTRLGEVFLAEGALAEALDAYREDLLITKRLAHGDPDNLQKQRDLMITESKIGDARRLSGDLIGAAAAYRAGLGAVDDRDVQRLTGLPGETLLVYRKLLETELLAGAEERARTIAEEALWKLETWAEDDPTLSIQMKFFAMALRTTDPGADPLSRPRSQPSPTNLEPVHFQSSISVP